MNMLPDNAVDKFIGLIKKKKLSGFFLSPENFPETKKSHLLAKWDHTTFNLKGGTLYLARGAHKKYGYTDEKAFVQDLTTLGIMASTYIGGLSLGPARFIETKATYLLMDAEGLWRMAWPMASEEEAIQARTLLREIFPKAVFRVSETERLSPLVMLREIPIGEFRAWLQNAPWELKKAAGATAICGLLSALSTVTFFYHRELLEIFYWIGIACFYTCFAVFIKQAYRWNNRRNLPLPA